MGIEAFDHTPLLARSVACAFLMLAAVALGPSLVSAQSSDEQARALFAEGETAYGEGRFEDALERFQRAYELSGRAELLYNVGISATNAGHEREAVAAFEGYLAALPEAPNRALVEGRLVSLRRELAEDETAARAAEAERAAVEQERTRQARERTAGADAMRTAGWALTISGAALGVTGAVLLGVGYADIATVDGAAPGTRWVDLRDANAQAPILTGVGWAGLGLGVALAGLGLGLALGAPSSEAPVSVSLGVGHVSIQGVF